MGDNTIHYLGHVKMMAAVQPLISGAITKCVTGDTLLATADGLVRIGRLHQDEPADTFRARDHRGGLPGGTQKTDSFYYGGVRPVRQVGAGSGHRVPGTPNHRLLVAGDGGLDWRRLDELEVGDAVAVHYGAELWSSLPARHDGAVARCRPCWPDEMTTTWPSCWAPGRGGPGRPGSPDRTLGDGRRRGRLRAGPAGRARPATWGFQRRVDGRRCGGARRSGTAVVVTSPLAVQLLESSAPASPTPSWPRPARWCSPTSRACSRPPTSPSTAAPDRLWSIVLESAPLLDDLQAVLTNLGVVHGGSAPNGDCDVVHAVATAQRLGRHGSPLRRTGPHAHRRERAAAVALVLRGDRPLTTAAGSECPARPRVTHLAGARGPRRACASARSCRSTDAGEREVYDLSVPATHAFVGNGIVNHNTDQHARGGHRRGRGAAPHRRLAHGPQGRRHLPRQLQGGPAPVQHQEERRPGRRLRSAPAERSW